VSPVIPSSKREFNLISQNRQAASHHAFVVAYIVSLVMAQNWNALHLIHLFNQYVRGCEGNYVYN